MQTIPFPVSAVAFPLQHGVRDLLENALDQALLIANTRGEVLFATRKTRVILQALFAEKSDDLVPNEIHTWLIKGDTSRPLVIRHLRKGEIEIHKLHLAPSGSLSLIRIEHRLVQGGPQALLALGLDSTRSGGALLDHRRQDQPGNRDHPGRFARYGEETCGASLCQTWCAHPDLSS